MDPYGERKSSVLGGMLLIVIGLMLLQDKWAAIRVSLFLPLILIGLGNWMIWKRHPSSHNQAQE